jgi:ubiquinone/menaquinone biosynthesis C-methylase UbiE
MTLKKEEIHKGVSEFYAGLVREGGDDCCAGCCSPQTGTGIAEKVGYTQQDLEDIPVEASGSSFGCGNPLAFAEVRPGETVLDLGSGGGIDCFLAADRVGKSGRVIGLDMTEEMVEKATKTAEQNGYGNVEFRLGKIEEMPVEGGSVDWVISNCVINLSPEKDKVFAETFRVLKPGGRLLISDVVAEGLPDPMREDISAWASCVAGAVTEAEYLRMIQEAGFAQVEIVDRLDYVKPSEEQPYQLASIRVKGVKKQTAKKEGSRMKNSLTALDRETQLLVAAGSAVAAGCMPCLETIVGMARADRIDEKKLKEAVMTGQYVKEQPANMMKEFADQLVGTHLAGKPLSTEGGCPLSGEMSEEALLQEEAAEGSCCTGGCCAAPEK